MTSIHMLPADDPSSVESFMRARRSQLLAGRVALRGSREQAERRGAEHDAERIVDLLRRMPVEYRLEGETNGNLQEVQYRWLRHHGLERGRVDAALAAKREELTRRVRTPSADPALTAGASPLGPRGSSGAPAVAQLRSDRLGVLRNVRAARRMGLDPARLWPGQAGLPGRPTVNLLASGLPDLRVGARPGRLQGGNPASTGPTTSGANRRAQGGPRMRAR